MSHMNIGQLSDGSTALASLKQGVATVLDLMYGTQERTNITLAVCFAMLGLAFALNQAAAHVQMACPVV